MSFPPQVVTPDLNKSHSRSLSSPLMGSISSSSSAWSSMKPTFRRGTSHRRDPFLSIRRIFKMFVPPEWRTDAELHLLAKNYVAVSVGMFTAHVVEDFPLDRLGSEFLAMKLDEVGATQNITFVVDIRSNRLIIANTRILVDRIASFPNLNEVTFITYGHGKYHRIPGSALDFLLSTIGLLGHSLTNRMSHVVQIGDDTYSPLQTASQVSVFCDWMAGSPVVFVSGVDAGIGSNKQTNEIAEWERLKSSDRRLVRILLEGVDAGHDHTLDLEIPKSLFHLDSLNEPVESSMNKPMGANRAPFELPLSLTAQNHFTFRDLQDRLQSLMFDRLNESDAAGDIWSDVSVVIED